MFGREGFVHHNAQYTGTNVLGHNHTIIATNDVISHHHQSMVATRDNIYIYIYIYNSLFYLLKETPSRERER